MTTDVKLDLINKRISLAETAREYGLDVHREGYRMVCRCPFCHKQNAFSINDEQHLFYCFACKASGDTIDFVGRMEKKNFGDTIDTLMAKIQVEDA